jgi:hypothetical protein
MMEMETGGICQDLYHASWKINWLMPGVLIDRPNWSDRRRAIVIKVAS